MKKIAVFFLGDSRRKWFIAASFGVILLPLLGFGYFQWSKNYRVVAKVGDKVITQKEYDEIAPRYSKYFKYSSNAEALKDEKKAIIDKLVEDEIIAVEAGKRNIVASKDDVEARYEKVLAHYGSEREYREAIKAAYDWTPELAKKSIETSILKEKLSEEVLKGYDLSSVYVRYDYEDLKTKPDIEKDSKAKLIEYRNKAVSGFSLEELGRQIKNDPKYGYPIAALVTFKQVNNANIASTFQGKEDWEAIKSLAKAGDISEIVRSGGGYYAFYLANRVGGGQFETWEAFLIDYKAKNVKVSRGTGIANLAANFLKTAKAFALSCNDNHYAQISGTVTDVNTGLAISGVAVTGYKAYGDLCSGDKSSETKYTDSRGRYQIGSLANSDGTQFMNCWANWDVKYEKSGYYTLVDTTITLQNGGGITMDKELTPKPVVNYVLTAKKTGDGKGTLSTGQVDNYAISCGTSCNSDTATYVQGHKTVIYASADADSDFKGWSGCDSVSGGACTVTMNGDKTITANFALKPPVPKSGDCGISVSPQNGEKPLTVNINLSFALPRDGASHNHGAGSYNEFDYTDNPTWYRVYWMDGAGRTGVIKEAGNPAATVGLPSIPSVLNYTFPGAGNYRIIIDYKFFADGCNYQISPGVFHATDEIVDATSCARSNEVKVREINGGTVIEIAP